MPHYDPNGWDHGAGWQGSAAHSLPVLAVLLGLIAQFGDELDSDDDTVRANALGELRGRMIAQDPCCVEESAFWDEIFESMAE
ncbi:hypothetical protein [Streptomyces sp. NPDC058739]|uniref:hypothetical protein n=1 Tax=Streptomyces sp. NPDC058739 TaxID=3346618 RepID=UPI0036B3F72D